MSEEQRLEITVSMGGQIYKRSLLDDLTVDEEHVNTYLVEAPGKTAWWHQLYEQQKTKVQKQEVALKRKHAELSKHYRKSAADDGQKISNAEVESLVISDPEYQNIEDALLDMQETLNLLRGAVEAVKELRSTLISLSANLRTEFKPTKFKEAGESASQRFKERFNR